MPYPMAIILRDPFDWSFVEAHLSAFKYRLPSDNTVYSLSFTTIHAPSHRRFTAGYHLEYYTQGLRDQLLNLSPLKDKVSRIYGSRV